MTPTPQPGGRASLSSTPPVRTPQWQERLDHWMAQHPWHPRLAPFAVYGAIFPLVLLAKDQYPPAYPVLYVLQCGITAYLLWRYRKLLPELTLTFDWLAIPVGVAVFFVWVWLGIFSSQPERVLKEGLHPFTINLTQWMLHPRTHPGYAGEGWRILDLGVTLGWTAMLLRLVGMSIIVPMFEELFVRSLLLRSLSRWRQTAIGFVQILQDLPLIGDVMVHTDLARRAHRHPPVFAPMFFATALGKITWFGLLASTLVFMFGHAKRDWLGAIACGLLYCLLLALTRKKGLGPVIWAHGITNALLWAYSLHTGDWQFL